MKIQWLVEDMWVSHKSYLLSVFNNIITLFIINLLYRANGPSTWANLSWSSGTGVCLINSIDLISHIKDHEAIGAFIHEHHVISKFQLPIVTIRLRHSLEGLRKFLLCLINHKTSLILLVQVISLVVLGEVELFGPVADSSLARVFWAT